MSITTDLIQPGNIQLSSSTPAPAVPEITLTPHQQEAHTKLLSYLTGSTPAPFAVLKGFAGTGKSVTVGKLVDSLKTLRIGPIGVCAPTHKAVKVLKRQGILGVDYRTLHSALALKENTDHLTGKRIYIPDKLKAGEEPIADLEVIFLDETSMLAKELFDRMVPWMKKGLKVVFIGDPAQIPPVKEKDSIPFLYAEKWGAVVAELSQTMRQKDGNPILEFATAIRSDYESGSFTPSQHLLNNGEGIRLISHADDEETALLQEYFACKEFEDDPDYMKVVAWRNTTVDKYNEIIRHIIYRDEAHVADIMQGERLIMDAPFVLSAKNIITSNEEIEVVNLSTGSKKVEYNDETQAKRLDSFLCYYAKGIWYTDGRERSATIPIIHESDKSRLTGLLNNMRTWSLEAPYQFKAARWRQYFNVLESFAWVKYNYCLTGHKSQGSTYDNCLVLKWDIDYNRNIEERNRILYVACTRARNTLFIEP